MTRAVSETVYGGGNSLSICEKTHAAALSDLEDCHSELAKQVRELEQKIRYYE
jgi:hypothetical protein